MNQKDTQIILEEKYKLRNTVLYDFNENENNNKSKEIFINQSLCPYYGKLYCLVKDLNNKI